MIQAHLPIEQVVGQILPFVHQFVLHREVVSVGVSCDFATLLLDCFPISDDTELGQQLVF